MKAILIKDDREMRILEVKEVKQEYYLANIDLTFTGNEETVSPILTKEFMN
jgi:hypothetical protein